MQTVLDLWSKPKIPADASETTQTFRLPERLKDDLQYLANAKGISVSKLILEYVLSGWVEDQKNIYMSIHHSDKPLREILK